ncbi:hypothetical protein [Candidatus Ichthyocystis sparus]|uniref:hypothetical protein n=1 Tax=Candidatus Ichthyocystis sparus TaxID=1561004 RepID=UPI000B83D07A|nr:hypothetical protein [Candidatus Ichthyocystis sparus]
MNSVNPRSTGVGNEGVSGANGDNSNVEENSGGRNMSISDGDAESRAGLNPSRHRSSSASSSLDSLSMPDESVSKGTGGRAKKMAGRRTRLGSKSSSSESLNSNSSKSSSKSSSSAMGGIKEKFGALRKKLRKSPSSESLKSNSSEASNLSGKTKNTGEKIKSALSNLMKKAKSVLEDRKDRSGSKGEMRSLSKLLKEARHLTEKHEANKSSELLGMEEDITEEELEDALSNILKDAKHLTEKHGIGQSSGLYGEEIADDELEELEMELAELLKEDTAEAERSSSPISLETADISELLKELKGLESSMHKIITEVERRSSGSNSAQSSSLPPN